MELEPSGEWSSEIAKKENVELRHDWMAHCVKVTLVGRRKDREAFATPLPARQSDAENCRSVAASSPKG